MYCLLSQIVTDDLPPSSEFVRVFANDSDVGLNGLVTYELMNLKHKFRIDAFTGAISTKTGIIVSDEENVVYDLSVVASDRGRPALRYVYISHPIPDMLVHENLIF